MQTERFEIEHPEALPQRRLWRAMVRGARGTCPECGSGRIFAKGLATRRACETCGEELHHHRADDLPAYLNIFIVGHLVVGLTVIAMDLKLFGMWTLVALACALALVLAFALMRPLKGSVLGAQWALRMHGFGGHDD